ncbi:hypothetical protein J3Q64DRAFT_1749386 [Phycomyces blakesleeanus]|uniref:Secreted protein n=1 Tax=Phycomyces blakesleeanus TaxID=4837 RepID=A0ABR3AW33_PHYBL
MSSFISISCCFFFSSSILLSSSIRIEIPRFCRFRKSALVGSFRLDSASNRCPRAVYGNKSSGLFCCNPNEFIVFFCIG